MGKEKNLESKYFKTPTDFEEAMFLLGNDIRRVIFIMSFMELIYRPPKTIEKDKDSVLIEATSTITIGSVYNGISEAIKLDYKSVHKQAKLLEKKGYITLNKHKKEQGQPVYIYPVINDRTTKMFGYCWDNIIKPMFEEKN